MGQGSGTGEAWAMTTSARHVRSHPILGEIPSGWMVRSVGELGEIRLGRQRSPQTETGAFMKPYLRVANVFDGYIDFADVLEMNFSPAEQVTYEVRQGDILLNEGQSLDLVGRCAKYEGPNGRYCFQNTLIRYRCSRLFDADFAYQLFSWWLRTRRFAGVAKQTTSIAHLGADRLAAMPAAIPPPPEQRQIVRILASVEESMRSTERLIVKLEMARQATLGDVLAHGVDDDGRVRTGEEDFVATSIGVIPRSWSIVALDDVSLGGGQYGSSSAARMFESTLPRYVRITDICADGSLSRSGMASISWDDAASYLLSAGDLCFARTGATVGKTYLYNSRDGACAFAGYVIRFSINPAIAIPEYVALWTRGISYWNWISGVLRQGAQPNINTREYGRHLMPLPPLWEQKRIVDRVKSLDLACSSVQSELTKLRSFKQGLLSDLLTGRVRVRADGAA